MVNDSVVVPDPSDRIHRRRVDSAGALDPMRWYCLVEKFVASAIICSALASPTVSGADELTIDEDIPNVLVTEKRIYPRDELLGSKIPLPSSDIPLSAERLDADTIERMGFTSLGPLLQAATSAAALPADGGAFNDILLRGFAGTPIYRNGINDSIGDMPVRSLANIAHIEVLKGPYGALYGPGEPGGSVNFVTKRPDPEPATDLSVGFGSYGEFVLELDSTGPLARTAKLNYRFIARREQADSFRNFVKRDRLFVNPMIVWHVKPDLRFDAAFEYISDERLLDTGVIASDGVFPLPSDRFLGEPSSGPAQIDGYTFQVSMLYQLHPDWALDFSVHGQKTQFRGSTIEPDELTRESGSLILNRSATRLAEESRVLIAQAELSGVQILRDIPHHLLVGMSATGVNEDNAFLTSEVEDNPFSINPFTPIYGRTIHRLHWNEIHANKPARFPFTCRICCA